MTGPLEPPPSSSQGMAAAVAVAEERTPLYSALAFRAPENFSTPGCSRVSKHHRVQINPDEESLPFAAQVAFSFLAPYESALLFSSRVPTSFLRLSAAKTQVNVAQNAQRVKTFKKRW